MANLLTGVTALYKGLGRLVFQWPTVLAAKQADDTIVLLKADGNGALVTSAVLNGDITIPSGSDFAIPAFDSKVLTYYTGTNNIETMEFKSGDATVATMTFTYVNGAVADDDLIASIVKTLPA